MAALFGTVRTARPASPRPMPDPSRQLATRAALDTWEPPSTVLLSAEKAKDRLARNRRRVFVPSAQRRGWKAHRAPARQKPARDFGGLFTFTDSRRRGPWSKALFRQGADPRTALTAVLGMEAEDIQVREPAGPEPPSKANTPPTVRPNHRSPNPNTGVAEQPSNAGPGFPSGDNLQRRQYRGGSRSRCM